MLGTHVQNEILYNARQCKKISLKNGERGKTSWEKPSPKKRDMYNKEEKSHVTPLVKNPTPQEISQMKILDLNEGLGEDIYNMLFSRTILQCSDLLMNQLSNVVYMNLNVCCALMLHWMF